MNEDEVRRRLGGRCEDPQLDFEGAALRDDVDKTADVLTKAVSAFANADGRQIVIGISAAHGPSNDVDDGVNATRWSAERLGDKIGDKIAPG